MSVFLLGQLSFFIPFASTAGGLRNCNAAPLAPFNENMLRIFVESATQTGPNEAANAITGVFKGRVQMV